MERVTEMELKNFSTYSYISIGNKVPEAKEQASPGVRRLAEVFSFTADTRA